MHLIIDGYNGDIQRMQDADFIQGADIVLNHVIQSIQKAWKLNQIIMLPVIYMILNIKMRLMLLPKRMRKKIDFKRRKV